MEKDGFVQITRRKTFSEEEFYPMLDEMYEQIWQNLLPPQILTDGLSNTVAQNVITPSDAPIPDCMTCGACCASSPCIGVSPLEKVPMEDFWEITAEGGIVVDRFLKRSDETFSCAALDGTIGEQVSCRIYEQRPRACRLFEAGSDKCHAVRRAYGIEPFLSLLEMAEAVKKLKAESALPASKDTIRNVKIVGRKDTNLLEITVWLEDGSTQKIHTFAPERESWMQFEFDGLTLEQARDLIISRNEQEVL
ncbi:MAG TPA: YkgJ family cysteine cluster protein [Pyrinomonadaceae bacterium]|nr:YkgJ family cysteine cluster protein [Pyrinomonadaceae bacterium]